MIKFQFDPTVRLKIMIINIKLCSQALGHVKQPRLLLGSHDQGLILF
jgi:hypothetical protein